MPPRWDGDDRGHGVGDASQLVAGANELVTAFGQSAWVWRSSPRSISDRT